MCWTPRQEVWVQDLGGSCVVFLGKTIYSYSTPLHPGAYIGTVELSGKPDEMLGEEGGGGGVLTL